MFNITPMIDIVFLLIIFFMTVSQITRVVDHPLPLPIVSQGTQPSLPTNVTINLNSGGQIYVSGREYTLEETVATIQNQINRLSSQPESLKVELRCDKRCPSRHVNRMMKELANLGIPSVKIAVTGEK